jgi:pyruvate,orthophosphate dikinase
MRVSGQQLSQLLVPQLAIGTERTLLTQAIPASPGAAVGQVVFDPQRAVDWAESGRPVVLVRRETNPDDLSGMVAAVGILTSRGGKTSHAAVVARGMGKPAVCGADQLVVDEIGHTAVVRLSDGSLIDIAEGTFISLDGASGEVFLGEIPVSPSPVVRYLLEGVDEVLSTLDPDSAAIVTSVDRLLAHADSVRKLRVRANADTPEDASRARQLGAEGIGLCRTEHMFLGERRELIEKVILADKSTDRSSAMDALMPLQRADFIDLLQTMNNLPVTVRLLDPPLHEFLPDRAELMVKVALQQAAGNDTSSDERLLAAVNRLHESNPMLGLRGVRLGLVVPGLFALQVRALAEAFVELNKSGANPIVEIMVPLVGSARELILIREELELVLHEVAAEYAVELNFPIGTMIELPRAALTAHRIAEVADFFSFGTNDLTQTTWGFSRDDVEVAFFAQYLEKGVLTISPFETIDADGVGRLVSIATHEGRQTKPELKLGVCGEHGGDPESIHFFHNVGLDYVSASPFRVPVARLEAGRAVIQMATSDSR